jgi:transposase-like protein
MARQTKLVHVQCCQKCKNLSIRKYGFTRGKQRFRCSSCGYVFTENNERDYPLFLKYLYAYIVNRQAEYGINEYSDVLSHHLKLNKVQTRRWCELFSDYRQYHVRNIQFDVRTGDFIIEFTNFFVRIGRASRTNL